jgi:environmental stress-induced protein Ves
MKKQILALALVFAIAPAAVGCRTAATMGAGAAAGAAAATTVNQNAEGSVSASISETDRRTRNVLRGMGMALTDANYEDNAMEREYEARSGDNVVHIKLVSRGASSTDVAVSYRRGRVDYSKTEAQNILTRIQAAR